MIATDASLVFVLAMLAHGGRVPGDEFAVAALGIALALVALSGIRRATTPSASPHKPRADSDDERTDPGVPQDE